MFNLVLIFVQCFTNFCVAYYIVNVLFENRCKSICTNIFIMILFSLMLASINFFGFPLINTIASSTIFALMMIILFKGKWYKLIFAGILINAIIISCEFISLGTISALEKTNVEILANIPVRNVSLSFISTGIFFILTIIIKLAINKLVKTKLKSTERLNIALLPLPILSIGIAYYIVSVSNIAEFSHSNVINSIIIVISLLIVNAIAFVSDSDSKKKYQYRAQIEEMRLQGEMKAALILQQDVNIRETNALVHDFQHQLNTLQILFAEEIINVKTPKITAYIEEALNNLPNINMYTHIECDAFRCILIRTHNECERLGIAFYSKLIYSEFDFMTYQDICTIFLNALENAIRACTEMRNKNYAAAITIKTCSMEDMVAIKIINEKINNISEKNGIICTTKTDEAHHGLGLLNIKRAVEKYNGNLDIKYADDTFELNILLPIKQ